MTGLSSLVLITLQLSVKPELPTYVAPPCTRCIVKKVEERFEVRYFQKVRYRRTPRVATISVALLMPNRRMIVAIPMRPISVDVDVKVLLPFRARHGQRSALANPHLHNHTCIAVMPYPCRQHQSGIPPKRSLPNLSRMASVS